MVQGLRALGVTVDEFDDGMVVHGTGGRLPANPGVVIETFMDHRIAMSFLVYGVAAADMVTIDDAHMIDTSFPGFAGLMNGLGADLRPDGANA
jgi:3-phosphoshikimate 1-carboxyvinyltransferase